MLATCKKCIFQTLALLQIIPFQLSSRRLVFIMTFICLVTNVRSNANIIDVLSCTRALAKREYLVIIRDKFCIKHML